jgi:cysteine desulfurase/selenocysteine lyase
MTPTVGVPVSTRHAVPFDAERIRADFPVLGQVHNGRPLVYLDNAATTQKPWSVIEALQRYYAEANANIHRGVYRLSAEATLAYERVRATVQRFLNAQDPHEIVFVRGTTEAVNLVAQSFLRPRLVPGDEILLSAMEHHSNIVPWQMVAEATGARIRVIPMTDAGELDLDAVDGCLTDRTRMLSVVHLSNSLGTINPVHDLIAHARARGVPVFVDGAQAAPHLPLDVRALDCDFYAFSGHKAFGPTGIGVLYGKAAHLEAMVPYQGGGEMIDTVTFERTTYAAAPAKFEAGTPHIAGAIGLGAALEYVHELPWGAVEDHERDLLAYATTALSDVPGVRLVGTAADKAAVVSFVMEGVHAHDIGTIVDQHEVAIRTGHHCTQPVMDRLGVPATARASFAFYNTRADVDRLVAALGEVREVFQL